MHRIYNLALLLMKAPTFGIQSNGEKKLSYLKKPCNYVTMLKEESGRERRGDKTKTKRGKMRG